MNNDSGGDLPIGTILNDKWVILEFVGKGGMGEVYRAHQLALKRDVAIKIVSKEWLEVSHEYEEELQSTLQRFQNEVQTMAQLRHPNILQIYDYGSFPVGEGDEKGSREYIAMEYIPGGTLHSTMSKDGFYPEEDLTRDWLLHYFLPVLDGVQTMHEAQIVHRDLKPKNILMDGRVPKIADFGLARSSRWKPVTRSIDVKGTIIYMAPEQFLDLKRTDHRADIYSLGKILFEAIAGEMSRNAKPLKAAGLKAPESPFFKSLDRIIQAATAEERDERTGSVDDMKNAIQTTLRGVMSKEEKKSRSLSTRPIRLSSVLGPRHRIRTGIVLAAILLTLFGLWYWHEKESFRKSAPLPEGLRTTTKDMRNIKIPEKGGIVSPPPTPLPKTLDGKDGVTLDLIPGGKFTFPDNFGSDSGKTVDVNPFYMDTTRVTNHQYVEFLNKVRSRVDVEKGIVQSEGTIWLLLGEIFEGYEPIVFRDGNFHVNNPAHASCPVLRVTVYGASAYARFYGRRLPTKAEWLYALLEGSESISRSSGSSPEASGNPGISNSMSEMMNRMMYEGSEAPVPGSVDLSPMPPPVMLSEPNAYGIRGLDEKIGEWALWGKEASSDAQKGEVQYVILRGAGVGQDEGTISPSVITRQPWEAFADVSFRCVLSYTDAQE